MAILSRLSIFRTLDRLPDFLNRELDNIMSVWNNHNAGSSTWKSSAKAWASVNISQVIGSAFNVASVTKTAVGRYQVNFTTAMADTNYAPFGSLVNAGGAQNLFITFGTLNTTNVSFRVTDNTGAFFDSAFHIVVFGLP